MKINEEVKKLLKKIIKDLEKFKAQDIEVLNIKNRSALGDYIVIVSGTSSRHINSIVTKIVKCNKKYWSLKTMFVNFHLFTIFALKNTQVCF